MWAAKQENFQPAEKCFFLTSPFIELTGQAPLPGVSHQSNPEYKRSGALFKAARRS